MATEFTDEVGALSVQPLFVSLYCGAEEQPPPLVCLSFVYLSLGPFWWVVEGGRAGGMGEV